MKRRDRSIETISLSAIDLFASALGAFIVITAVLIPYYPNLKDGHGKVAVLEREVLENQKRTARAVETEQLARAEARRRREQQAAAAKARAQRRRINAAIQDEKNKNIALRTSVTDLTKNLSKLRKEKQARRRQFTGGQSEFSILGLVIKARSIVILVDLSGSMRSWSDLMVQTLTEIVSSFHDKIRFAILGYQGTRGVSQFWPRRKQMAIGDTRSKSSALAFVRSLPNRFDGSTPTQTALLTALTYKPQAIVLISDGSPTDAEPDDIVAKLTRLNRGVTAIHTVALGNYLKHPELVVFLSKLAARNKGRFVGVIR